MKVVAFNGSPRKDGNTAILLRRCLAAIEKAGIETELVQLSGHAIRGCVACMWCTQNKVGRCVNNDDIVNESIGKMIAADGILLGSPTYFTDVTAEMKALIDRAGFVGRFQDLYTRKVGAAVVAVRRAGATHVFDTINHFFLINQMIVPGGTYWNMGYGRAVGEVENDAEGMTNMDVLGQNIAWLLQKIHA